MGNAETAAAIDGHLIIILGIMVATGLLGGLANFFLNERDSHSPWGTAGRYMILGVVAALTVPLFLNMMSSHLLEATRLKSSELFVFAGFCLLYVVVSRRFFENIAAGPAATPPRPSPSFRWCLPRATWAGPHWQGACSGSSCCSAWC